MSGVHWGEGGREGELLLINCNCELLNHPFTSSFKPSFTVPITVIVIAVYCLLAFAGDHLVYTSFKVLFKLIVECFFYIFHYRKSILKAFLPKNGN